MKKVILITGAAKGLGFEAAKQLGKKGFTILITARTQEKKDDTIAKLKTLGIDTYGVQLDINNQEEVSDLVKFIEETFGKKIAYQLNKKGMSEPTAHAF